MKGVDCLADHFAAVNIEPRGELQGNHHSQRLLVGKGLQSRQMSFRGQVDHSSDGFVQHDAAGKSRPDRLIQLSKAALVLQSFDGTGDRRPGWGDLGCLVKNDGTSGNGTAVQSTAGRCVRRDVTIRGGRMVAGLGDRQSSIGSGSLRCIPQQSDHHSDDEAIHRIRKDTNCCGEAEQCTAHSVAVPELRNVVDRGHSNRSKDQQRSHRRLG
mmetsp:Transcript_23307/g.51211  ORF Transcript_23307/g.51211 Transcript_23307/m.51211 type:complete len:212 (+) Transcript_23307:418-1053(+)